MSGHADRFDGDFAELEKENAALVAENQQLTADRDSWRNIAQQLKHTEAVELREAKAANQRNAEKVAAYDAARATVKIEGRTRAFYVLRAEAAEAEIQQLRDALGEIDTYIEDLAYPRPETKWIAGLVRAVLEQKGGVPAWMHSYSATSARRRTRTHKENKMTKDEIIEGIKAICAPLRTCRELRDKIIAELEVRLDGAPNEDAG